MPTSCPKLLKETEGIEAEYASSQKKWKGRFPQINAAETKSKP